uniref:Uncharacterized protein n=1 Tax=Panagrellus redivivus TaxID=6233 RepID=A0A7E4ZXP2_PANRE
MPEARLSAQEWGGHGNEGLLWLNLEAEGKHAKAGLSFSRRDHQRNAMPFMCEEAKTPRISPRKQEQKTANHIGIDCQEACLHTMPTVLIIVGMGGRKKRADSQRLPEGSSPLSCTMTPSTSFYSLSAGQMGPSKLAGSPRNEDENDGPRTGVGDTKRTEDRKSFTVVQFGPRGGFRRKCRSRRSYWDRKRVTWKCKWEIWHN